MFLVRHGETEFNAAGRVQGRFDSPLTQAGIRQAEAIGYTLKTVIGTAEGWTIECSPLGRAVRTAELICAQAGLRAKLIIDDRLREVSLGSWDGLTRKEIVKGWPGALGGSLRQSWVQNCPDGESMDDATKRLSCWLTSHPDHRTLIVVSHGIAGSLLRGIYGKLSRDEMLALPTPQDCFHELVDGGLRLLTCERPKPGS